MTTTAHLDLAIFDAADIDEVGSFYAALTGWDVVRRDADRFGLRTPDGQEIEFQRAPDHVAPRWPGQEHPQQFHLDLQTDDPRAQAERAVGLGATRLADGPTEITLTDPAGHPFDLCQADGLGPLMRLCAVTIDAPDASALARFYAASESSPTQPATRSASSASARGTSHGLGRSGGLAPLDSRQLRIGLGPAAWRSLPGGDPRPRCELEPSREVRHAAGPQPGRLRR